MNRRKLLSWFGLGWLVSILPSSLIGCSESSSPSASASATPTTSAATTVAAAPSGNFKELGTVAQLDKDGQLVSNKISVVRQPNDKTKLLAVSTVCTHKQCDVKWKSDKYVCPCHEAEFAPDGKVLLGPAKQPLPTYAAKIENGKVLVSV
jgi:cytochrome b6-f complex iron-sulfur subunit